MEPFGQVMPFLNDGRQVRGVEHEGQAWFALADLCKILGITDSSRVTKRLDADEWTETKVASGGGQQMMLVVNEPGMYHLVLTSRSPEAHNLRRWLTHEVIPAIRRQGAYVAPWARAEYQARDRIYELRERIVDLAMDLPITGRKRRELVGLCEEIRKVGAAAEREVTA